MVLLTATSRVAVAAPCGATTGARRPGACLRKRAAAGRLLASPAPVRRQGEGLGGGPGRARGPRRASARRSTYMQRCGAVPSMWPPFAAAAAQRPTLRHPFLLAALKAPLDCTSLRPSSPSPSPAGRAGALRCRAVAAPPAVETDEHVLSTARFDDAGITLHSVKRTTGGAVSYSVEVSSDNPRPNAVLHWAVNDWALPPQVHAWRRGWGWSGSGRRDLDTQAAGVRSGYELTLSCFHSLTPSAGELAPGHQPGGRQGGADAAARRTPPHHLLSRGE